MFQYKESQFFSWVLKFYQFYHQTKKRSFRNITARYIRQVNGVKLAEIK